ncbi:MAG TPA: PA14 domain-containing protein, partial [Planctomycetota bacterium]|nr:PA14 domain-containing protein [Planctomycetota bacterium]
MRRTMLAFILILLTSAAHADGWDDAWGCRRTVVFPDETRAAHFEVVFPNHGLGQEPGWDVRVITDGKEVPSCVMSVTPGGATRVVFERRGTAPHHIYWNNPAAPPRPATPLHAGVLFQSASYDGSAVNTLGEWHARWATARTQGARYVPGIHLGHNPLGPGENFLSRFTGWFRAPVDGDYVFATDSDDASFLLVDSRLVTQWPGAHGATGQARHVGTIRLRAGVHRIEYLHAQSDGGLLMNAAWQPPGTPQPVVMPPEAFVPVERASVGRIERRDGVFVPDFLVTNVGQAVLDPDATQYLVKMHFENLADAATLETHATRWFFGDGTTSTEVSPDHVYLKPGDYDVTLVMVRGYEELKFTAKVQVERDWDREPRTIDLRESYYDIIRT